MSGIPLVVLNFGCAGFLLPDAGLLSSCAVRVSLVVARGLQVPRASVVTLGSSVAEAPRAPGRAGFGSHATLA